MTRRGFYLLTENTFESCYFVSRFITALGHSSRFLGVLIAEPPPPPDLLLEREQFHSRHHRVYDWNEKLDQMWSRLYQPLSPAGRRMIEAYGLPRYPNSQHDHTIFLGSDINTASARHRMEDLLRIDNRRWLVTYLPRMIQPWLIELAHSQVLNCHSAVLPYARGLHAIENIAASRDIDAFRTAAGITIHYIDNGIDTGPIIRAERIVDPFRFDSLWDLKGHLYHTGVTWYIRTVRDIIESDDTVPAGIIPSAALKATTYYKTDFTPKKARQAETGYLWMKSRLSSSGV